MIKLFNDSLNARYLTLERNIKSKSNSFYDSYLDLLEATIKYFLDENNIPHVLVSSYGILFHMMILEHVVILLKLKKLNHSF